MIWLFCRLIPLPLLVYLLGQYLDGPPYRVIVRSIPFVLFCFAVAGLAAQFLHQQRKPAIGLLLFQGMIVPLCFILSLQQYYNGGINAHYTVPVLLFGILMGLNGSLYLNSLLTRPDWIPKITREENPLEPDYMIELLNLTEDGTVKNLKYRDAGSGTPPQVIVLDGYSTDQIIDLEPYWNELEQNRGKTIYDDISVRETIIKFGETMQLVDHYRLLLSLKDTTRSINRSDV